MRNYGRREDDQALDKCVPKVLSGVVLSAENLTTNEHLSFSIFQRGELAALAGLRSDECPFHGEERYTRWQEIWHRGFVYGSREGEESCLF